MLPPRAPRRRARFQETRPDVVLLDLVSGDTEAVGLLERYRWSGNVRGLRSVIAHATLLHDEDLLRPTHLRAELMAAAPAAPVPGPDVPDPGASIPTLEAVELGNVRRVLEICGGNRTLAAQHLGITRQTLAKKVHEE